MPSRPNLCSPQPLPLPLRALADPAPSGDQIFITYNEAALVYVANATLGGCTLPPGVVVAPPCDIVKVDTGEG